MSDIDWTLMLACVLVGVGGATVAAVVVWLLGGTVLGIRWGVRRVRGRHRAVSPPKVKGDHSGAPMDALTTLRRRLVDDGHLPEQSLAGQNGRRGGPQ